MPPAAALRVRPRPDPDGDHAPSVLAVPPFVPPFAPADLQFGDHPHHPGHATDPTGLGAPGRVAGPGPEPAAPADLLEGPDPTFPLDGFPLDEAPPTGTDRQDRQDRRVRPAWLAAVAVGCLAVGALGGAGWSHADAQHQLDAATHVFLWTDGTQLPAGSDAFAGSVGTAATGTRLRVNLLVTGSPVILQRVLLGAGQGESTAGITLLPGVEVTADLDLRPDCAALARDGEGVVADLSRQHAVVRPAGSQRTREVPLDVLADPAALMLPLVAPCSSATAAQASAEGLESDPVPTTPTTPWAGTAAPSPAVTVVGLTASPTGRLTFTLRSRGTAVTRFALPVAATVGSRTRFTLRTRPALPLTLRPGTAVRVTVDVTVSCRSHTGALPPTYGLIQPQGRLAGAPTAPSAASAEVPVEGWDDGTAAAAVTAATLRGCR